MYHRRIASERELSKEALKCYKIIELLEDAHVRKTVFDIDNYYPKLVKEIIVNLLRGFNDAGSSEFGKVLELGHFFSFSLAIINKYMG